MSVAPAAPRSGQSVGGRVEAPAAAQSTPAVKIWATIGAIVVALDVFFITKWVTGPRFTPVKSGPDTPSDMLRISGTVAQIVLPAAMLLAFYICLVRPWLRRREVTLDGMLCVAFLLVSVWDPLSNYGQDWFTYRSDLVNMGSIVGELPGVLGRHEAGAGEAWSILVIMPIYVSVFIGLSALLCQWMAAIKRRFPSLSWVRMILVCFAMTMVADVVIEGLLTLRVFGFYAFSGGRWLINGGHYYQFPLHEMVFGGAVFASFVCLRYFRNDRGETIVERGSETLRLSSGRKTGVRALAVIGAVHVGFLVCYHLPTALFAMNQQAWPKDVISRSYFTNRVCGPQVDRACPGPTTPISGRGKPYLNYEGKLVTPGS